MNEWSASGPVTVDRLVADLRALGVRPGSTLVVHSSLSSLGWVCGGAQAVVLALLEVLGADGTPVVPTHSGDLGDPADWVAPPVPEAWWETIRRTMPAFDRHLTPTRLMGAIPDCVLRHPDVRRSDHPQVSFAAVGRHAARVTNGHRLAFGLGEGSPLAQVYDLDGDVLLVGVDHDRNTSLHLAEYRATWPAKQKRTTASPLTVEGERRWVTYADVDIDSDDFLALGAALVPTMVEGRIGEARSLLMHQRVVVDEAVAWMGRSRSLGGGCR